MIVTKQQLFECLHKEQITEPSNLSVVINMSRHDVSFPICHLQLWGFPLCYYAIIRL